MTGLLERKSSAGAQEHLGTLLERFCAFGEPIEVNFRTLLTTSDANTRGAHLIHPYPAKLLVNIPKFFLDALAPRRGTKLLDPFCGSGTALYEGLLAGLDVSGSDANPLARLLTQAKLMPINRALAREEIARVMVVQSTATPMIPDVVNRAYWFSERISNELGRIRSAIANCVCPQHRAIFDVSLSATVRRVSYADPRLSVPVKINPKRGARYGAKGDEVIRRFERLDSVNVSLVFWSIVTQNVRRVLDIATAPKCRFELYEDARSIGMPSESVDLTITSPPYVGAQKYVRASSLSLGWLGLTPGCKLRPLEEVSIGREHLLASELLVPEGTGVRSADNLIEQIADRNPTRARIAQKYLFEMRQALVELARTMKDGAQFVLVVGPNLVAGLEFATPCYLQQIAEQVGFSTQLHLLDSIDSRGLMTKRNRTAGLIQQESVFLMQRVRCDV